MSGFYSPLFPLIRSKNRTRFGFSVRATIAWLCSAEKLIDGMVGYYGSRIRHYTEILPQMLFYLEKEHSFNVDELISNLDTKQFRDTQI